MNWNRKEIKLHSKNMIRKDYWRTFIVSALQFSFSTVTIASTLTDFSKNIPELIKNVFNSEFSSGNMDTKVIMILVTLISCITVLLLIARAFINIFFAYPIQVGSTRYMKNTVREDTKGKIADVFQVFDGKYLNCVKIMFIYNALLTIGSLMFVLPGIYFSYKFRMVPYIIDDDPEISVRDAFSKSSEIMKGNMINVLMLDLSFIPLYILGFLTLGFVELFYTEPYKDLVDAQLYLTLTERNEE